MLSEKFLNEFEEYLKSGRLEEDYACSAEDRKVEILEYRRQIGRASCRERV